MVGLGRPADGLRLTNCSSGTGGGPGYNSFGAPPPAPAPEGEGLFPDKGDSDISVAERSSDGDGIDGGRRDRGSASGGGGRQAIVTAALFVWAAAASLAAALLATSRGDLDASGDKGAAAAAAAAAATATTKPTTRTSSPGSFAARTTASNTAAAGGGGGGGGGGASGPNVNGKSDSNGNGKSNSWCLPNAAHQSFSGVVLKEDDGVMPQGEWEGEHWWYHDEITNGFHMAVTIGGDTYGFWDLGIIGAAGNTEYVAAYKGDRCLFYEEKVQPGSTPFDEDVTCRGSAWAGNVTLKEQVEFGYGTKAERWAGTIVDDEDTGYGGLPPGTESLVDLQRNPDDQSEVRLLYHRVVAPTNGVLGWASGDSLSFDLVFTNLDMMAANDVLDLVKVPSICEVMAGEFHDQQARGNAGGAVGRGGGRERSRRALLPSPEETTRSRTPASTSSLYLPSRGNEHTETGREESWPPSPRAAVAEEEERSEKMHHPSVPLRTPAGRRREEENRIVANGDIADGRRGGIGAVGIGSEGYRNPGDVGGGGGSRGGLRGLLAAVEQQKEQQKEEEEEEEGVEEEEEGREAEEGRGRSFVSGDDGGDDAWLTSPGDVPAGESDASGERRGRGGEGRPESEEAATAGLLPIHLLLRSLGRQGYRRRG